VAKRVLKATNFDKRGIDMGEMILLVILPAVLAAGFLLLPEKFIKPGLKFFALVNLTVLFFVEVQDSIAVSSLWGLDSAGKYFLWISAIIWTAAVWHPQRQHTDESFSLKTYGFSLLLFLASLNLVCLSLHLGLLWAAVEATTLASAPLIYLNKNARSLEATWKYLLICSVGIALALMGNLFTGIAGLEIEKMSLTVLSLKANAPELNPIWVKLGFIFLFIGYGTKIGLAPMHTWLPDAHSESKAVISALLSAALLNGAFLALMRVSSISLAAGYHDFIFPVFMTAGLLSMLTAGIFILRQTDFKRLLAYSSIEHMGILALGFGLGGKGIFFALYHAFNHSLGKAAMFLLAGNIATVYRTTSVLKVRNLSRNLPLTACLWVAGFLLICGTPPGGVFFSKMGIAFLSLERNFLITVAYLLFLALVFWGMGSAVMKMNSLGEPDKNLDQPEFFKDLAVPLALLTALIATGLIMPDF
jgi:hydrogenase-4 component F